MSEGPALKIVYSERLEAEIERLKKSLDDVIKWGPDDAGRIVFAELRAAREQIEELAPDAARFRLLRQHPNAWSNQPFPENLNHNKITLAGANICVNDLARAADILAELLEVGMPRESG